ncbi:MAG: hypothetical protein OJF61_002277 [Rhodanobacteraceae bacterium]|nr:MAG: hypothetical protein OJF61_002277 [Rhodanobacteraceae bacterium]
MPPCIEWRSSGAASPAAMLTLSRPHRPRCARAFPGPLLRRARGHINAHCSGARHRWFSRVHTAHACKFYAGLYAQPMSGECEFCGAAVAEGWSRAIIGGFAPEEMTITNIPMLGC